MYFILSNNSNIYDMLRKRSRDLNDFNVVMFHSLPVFFVNKMIMKTFKYIRSKKQMTYES